MLIIINTNEYLCIILPYFASVKNCDNVKYDIEENSRFDIT